jgi:hypothetical protein
MVDDGLIEPGLKIHPLILCPTSGMFVANDGSIIQDADFTGIREVPVLVIGWIPAQPSCVGWKFVTVNT